MADNKLTDVPDNNVGEIPDNVITKAFDILDKLDFFGGQRAGRELWNEKPFDVQNEDIKIFSQDIMFLKDLINRLEAENERLKGHQKDGFFNLLGNCLVFSKTLEDYNNMRKELKTKAYKEFAERLKEEMQEWKYDFVSKPLKRMALSEVDNLLKEMVGGNNGK